MRLARIRSSDPNQLLRLKRELRSAGYVVELLGLSDVSPWNADLELLVETTRMRDADVEPDEPRYRIFVGGESFGPVYTSVSQVLARTQSSDVEAIGSGIPLPVLSMQSKTAVAGVIILIVAFATLFLSWRGTQQEQKAEALKTNPIVESFAPVAVTKARTAARSHVETSSRVDTAKRKPPAPRYVHTEQPAAEEEVVVTHFEPARKRPQETNANVKRFSDLD